LFFTLHARSIAENSYLTSDAEAEFTTNFDIELIQDFFWDMEFYTSYDSEPISTVAETIDYGVNLSLAYKF
jgi:hypothetical protein